MTSKETITTIPSHIVSMGMDCTNAITYESHQKYILNLLYEKNTTLIHIETKAYGLDDFHTNELLDKYCVAGMYKVPSKGKFVGREEAYNYYREHFVYYVSEVEYDK